MTPRKYITSKGAARIPSGVSPLKTISILRLDTDWYESTVEELKAFWPKLSAGGIMNDDDYGFWAGQRKALHEFFAGKDVFFCPTDFSGCILVKG